MDRVYMNRRDGERRIHIEIDETEIANLLNEAGQTNGPATTQLMEILATARQRFQGSQA